MPAIRAIALAAILCGPAPAQAQSGSVLNLLAAPADIAMISYRAIGSLTAITPADVFEIEISDSGNITDVFVRLSPRAAEELAEWTELAVGFPMVIAICGAPLVEAEVQAPVTSGTIYIPNLNALQAQALRAIWHGRQSCNNTPPEVFSIAQ